MKIKEHPLLSPPEALTINVRLTGRDIELVEREIEKSRQHNFGGNLRIIYYYLRQLGIRDDIPPADAELIREGSINDRKDVARLSQTPEIAHQLQVIGLPQPITGEELRNVEGFIDAIKREKPGWDLACQYYYLNAVGVRKKVTDEERNWMLEDLERLRGKMPEKYGPPFDDFNLKPNGYNLAQLHHWLRGLGIPQTLTGEDIRAIESSYAKSRREKKAYELLETCFLAQQLTQEGEKPQQKMPPIREFER